MSELEAARKLLKAIREYCRSSDRSWLAVEDTIRAHELKFAKKEGEECGNG
jgi:hypothetical protein